LSHCTGHLRVGNSRIFEEWLGYASPWGLKSGPRQFIVLDFFEFNIPSYPATLSIRFKCNGRVTPWTLFIELTGSEGPEIVDRVGPFKSQL